MKPSRYRISFSLLRLFVAVPVSLACTSCVSTSLSNPTGSSHSGDLNVYELTGVSDNPTDAEIRSASHSQGTLPAAGARILLVQSGATQPDPELMAGELS
jgi:hypothetical protein